MSHFDHDIRSITPPVLHSLADHVETFSQQLRRVANENEYDLASRRTNARRQRTIKEASIAFLALIEDGISTQDALTTVTDKYCLEPTAVKMTASLYRAKFKKIQTVERNRRIMHLYQKALTQDEIAAEMGLCRKTVQRVIREFLRI